MVKTNTVLIVAGFVVSALSIVAIGATWGIGVAFVKYREAVNEGNRYKVTDFGKDALTAAVDLVNQYAR